MHPYLQLTLTALSWLVYPLYGIAYLLLLTGLYVLHPLYSLLLIVLQPVIFAGVVIARLAYLPIDIIARFETIYIYLGVGGLVGVVAGVTLHLIFSTLTSIFGLKHSNRPVPIYRHREPRAQQAARAPGVSVHKSPNLPVETKTRSDPARLFVLPRLTLQGPSPEGKQQRTLLDQTLDEDDDSEI